MESRKRNYNGSIASSSKNSIGHHNIETVSTYPNPRSSPPPNSYISSSTLDSRTLPEKVAKIGRITKMKLINFMCHSNLIVDFNDKVNIFVGNNGSGKSAILTAVVIGLGSTASSASRSTNLKDLIKRGENSTTIEIHLRNDGCDSFEDEVYGDTIIMIRHITLSGASTYKIKDCRGIVKSTQLSDMKRILLYMNIQVDNPICVLNQEAARTFLKESDEKKRYTLFLKATQIETVINKLNDCSEIYNIAKAQLVTMSKRLDVQKKEYTEIKEKYQKLLSVESLKGNVNSLKQELLWSYVREKEKIVTEFELEYKIFEDKINKIKESIENRQGILNGLKQQQILLATDNTTLTADFNTKKTQYDSMRNVYVDQNTAFTQLSRVYETSKSKIKRLEKEINQLRASIAERDGSFVSKVEEMRKTNEVKIKALEEKREENKIIVDNLKRDIDILKNNSERLDNDLEGWSSRRREALNKETQISSQLRQIDVKNNNRVSVYGNYMPKLLEVIEKGYKRGMFSELPRGPIGQYIEVPNPKFRAAIENIVGRHLTSFCFNNIKDNQVFDKLVKAEIGELPNFTRIVSKFINKAYDLRNGICKPPKGTTLLLNEMQISDTIVRNIMIDQMKIETILLTDGPREAQQYTSDESIVPNNLLKIISIEPFAEYCPAPNFRSYGMVMKPCRLLQANMEQYKIQLDQELHEIKQELQNVIQINIQKYQTEVKDLQFKIKEKTKTLRSLEVDLLKLNNQVMDIKNVEYPTENETDMLKNELVELEKSRDSKTVECAKYEENHNNMQKSIADKEREISTWRKEIHELETNLQKKKLKITKVNDDIEEFKRNSQYNEDELKQLDQDKKKIAKSITETKKKLNIDVKTAEEVGERIDHDRSDHEIKELIKNVESKIRKICSLDDDINVVGDLLKLKEDTYKNTLECIDKCSLVLTSLHESRISRYKWIQKYKQGISLNVKHVFLRILQLRNFRGDLNINNRDMKLELNIVPQDKNIDNAVSNTKSLSGGERSFATLAFLLSLWSCVSQPFYFLDEYDVFTDEVNRNIMTNLLIHEAKTRQDRQFCFFTPQDMSFVAESPAITFHSLEDHTKQLSTSK